MLAPGRFNLMPPVVKNLLIINGLMFLATKALHSSLGIDLIALLGLHYFDSEAFQPFQFLTYLFLHADTGHIFFNMFAVWMFGTALENAWGPKRFLIFYLVTGFGAGLLHYGIVHIEMMPEFTMIENFLANPNLADLQEFINQHKFVVNDYRWPDITSRFDQFQEDFAILQNNPENISALNGTASFMKDYAEHLKSLQVVVGASGSLFGLLAGFGLMYPNQPLYLYFLFPIKAKYFVIGYAAIELIWAFQNNPGDNVAHFAHIGGMIFGVILMKIWKIR